MFCNLRLKWECQDLQKTQAERQSEWRADQSCDLAGWISAILWKIREGFKDQVIGSLKCSEDRPMHCPFKITWNLPSAKHARSNNDEENLIIFDSILMITKGGQQKSQKSYMIRLSFIKILLYSFFSSLFVWLSPSSISGDHRERRQPTEGGKNANSSWNVKSEGRRKSP